MSNHFSKPIKHKIGKDYGYGTRRVPTTFKYSYLDGAFQTWYIIHIAF